MKKKIIAILTFAAVTLSMTALTGCGSSDSSDDSAEVTTEAYEEEETDAAADDEDAEDESDDEADEEDESDDEADAEGDSELESLQNEYIDAVANTCWVGMDPEYTCYAVAFGDEKIAIEASDGSSLEGYWGIGEGETQIHVYDDAELTNEIGAIDWSYDEENNVMTVGSNGAALVQTDAYSIEDAADAMQKESEAAKVAEFLEGTYWAGGTDDGNFYQAIQMDGNNISVIQLDVSSKETHDGTFTWALDYDNLYIYDDTGALTGTFGWQIAEDGSVLKLQDSSGSTYTLEQVSEEDATDVGAYLMVLAGLSE